MFGEKFSKIIRDEEGSGLILSLMVLLVLSTLGLSLGVVTVGSYRLGDVNRESNSAYYIAEAGANMAYEEIENNVMNAYNNSENPTSFFKKMDEPFEGESTVTFNKEFQTQFGDQPTAQVELIGNLPQNDIKEYTIKSTGIVNGKTRTVEKPVEITWIDKNSGNLLPIPPLDSVITFKETLKFGSNGSVTGDIKNTGSSAFDKGSNFSHRNGTEEKSHFEWSMYDQNIIKWAYPMETAIFEQPNYSNVMNSVSKSSTITLTENTYIPSIILSSNNTLDIKIQGENIYLILDKLDLSSNNTINVTGNGTLNIFVKDFMDFSSNIDINKSKSIEDINIIYLGKNNVEFSSNLSSIGSIYSKQASLNFKSNVLFNGDVFVNNGNIDINSNGTVHGDVLVNQGNIDFHSNASVKGNIITNNGKIVLNSNADIIGAIISSGGYIELGSNAAVQGNIFSLGGDIDFGSNASVTGAIISGPGKVDFDSNADVNGLIISDTLIFGSGADVKHSTSFIKNFPFESDENNSTELNLNELIASESAIESNK